MGGMAVQRILADAPTRVRRLVAVTPVPASGVPFDEQGWHLFSGAPTSRDNRRMIIDFSTGNRLSKAWIDHMARYSEETSTREAFAATFRGFRAVLGEENVATLIDSVGFGAACHAEGRGFEPPRSRQ